MECDGDNMGMYPEQAQGPPVFVGHPIGGAIGGIDPAAGLFARPQVPPSTRPTAIPHEAIYCRLENFEIEKKVGRGQFSVVYKAKCRLNGQPVALKKVQVCSYFSKCQLLLMC